MKLRINWLTDEVVVPASPIQFQVLFIGGEDMVQVVDANGQPDGETAAKQWHDFIGFTPDTADGTGDLGWVSVNHEMIAKDDKIGDGGGMTAFKVKRDPNTDTLMIVEQTLADGRQGDFFNVDFVNTVGETGMNCGGINGPDGRIWTAEEWFRTSTSSIYDGGDGVRDTAAWTIDTDLPGNIDGQTIPKYQNFNYMVEIDPREAKAIRKQYNWGRQGFEGGAFSPDGKTVYLGVDGTPAFWLKFEATTVGDYTDGQLYVYKHDGNPKWIAVDNEDLAVMLDLNTEAVSQSATMFNRIEWVVELGGKIYFTETGRDNPGSRWADEAAGGAVYAPHHVARAAAQSVPNPGDGNYEDIYGRVCVYDPATETVEVLIEGGPDFSTSPSVGAYPDVHLSNPDGLNKITIHDQDYLLIQEDLNGSSFGRVPAEVGNRTCEMYMLDMSIENPTYDDLVRIAIVPIGAEITGAIGTPDGKTILCNSQHPSTDNPFPYNNSLTFAMTGWDKVSTSVFEQPSFSDEEKFQIYPNPASRIVYFNEVTDIAVYDITGKRLLVKRNVKSLDISRLDQGTYFVRNLDGVTKKLVIQ